MTYFEKYEALCKSKNIAPSGKEAQECIGVSKGVSSAWRNKEGSLPSGDMLKKVCIFFDISADWLLGLIDTPHPLKIDSDEKDFSENEIKLITAYRNRPEMQTAVNTLLGINSDSADESDKNAYQIKKTAHDGSKKATIAGSEDNIVEIPYVARSETGERGTIVKTQEEIDEFLKNLTPDTSGQY